MVEDRKSPNTYTAIVYFSCWGSQKLYYQACRILLMRKGSRSFVRQTDHVSEWGSW